MPVELRVLRRPGDLEPRVFGRRVRESRPVCCAVVLVMTVASPLSAPVSTSFTVSLGTVSYSSNVGMKLSVVALALVLVLRGVVLKNPPTALARLPNPEEAK